MGVFQYENNLSSLIQLPNFILKPIVPVVAIGTS